MGRFYRPFVFVAFDRVARPIGESSFRSTLFFPISWVAMDVLFSLIIADQGSIAYTQFDNRLLLHLSSVTGMTGITFIIAWTASSVSWAYENQSKGRYILSKVLIFSGIVGSALIFGYVRIQSEAFSDPVKVAAITMHRNHPASYVSSLRVNPKDVNLRIELDKKYAEVFEKSVEAARQGAKIILWSEVLGDTIDDQEGRLLESAKRLALDSHLYLFAALGINSSESPLTDNKVILFKPTGDSAFSYQKSNLSPGEMSIQGERKFLFADTEFGRLGAAICADFNFSYFMKGAGENSLDIVFDPAYEWVEVERIQKAAAVMRAVENGFNLVKATSSGYSLVATYTGKILSQSDETLESPLVGDVPTKGKMTIYASGGWLFPLLILIFFLILFCKNRTIWLARIHTLFFTLN